MCINCFKSSLDATPFYLCTSRCVRRAFLCGNDPLTGRSYEHRRHRIEHDLLRLASIFFIDVVAFCVLTAKLLNENIARSANYEDKCTGHFWEFRYKSQVVLDEKAVLSAMAYTDLNPIRAAMVATPKTSDHTGIKLRVGYWKRRLARTPLQMMKHSSQNHSSRLSAITGNPCREV